VLPNAHNDFIFAILGEELGFVGAFLVITLFGVLVNAARHEPEAVAALRRRNGQGRASRLLRLGVPEPYRASTRSSAGG